MDHHGAELSRRSTAVNVFRTNVGCGRKPVPHLVGLVALAAALGTSTGCGADRSTPSDAEPFPDSSASLEELGERAFHGVLAGGTEALELLRITENEHNAVLWPELPSSDPALNVDLDYLWRDIESRNRAAVSRAVGWFEEREAEYATTSCRGETQVFASFQVHTDCWVSFRSVGPDSEDVVAYELQLFKDAIERGGGFKIFRYYDEAPTRVTSGPDDS